MESSKPEKTFINTSVELRIIAAWLRDGAAGSHQKTHSLCQLPIREQEGVRQLQVVSVAFAAAYISICVMRQNHELQRGALSDPCLLEPASWISSLHVCSKVNLSFATTSYCQQISGKLREEGGQSQSGSHAYIIKPLLQKLAL